tara:strand:- start:77 stop:496 length:420 start_codon:yes stop_codon:yes gene_type:complete
MEPVSMEPVSMEPVSMEPVSMEEDTNNDKVKNKSDTAHIKVCIFCSNKGIPLPHNHTIRDFSKKSNPIICPQLLNITCNYCKKKGHTKNYCHLLEQKNKIDKAIPNYKRLGFKNDLEINPTKMPKLGILTSAFGAMDME